MFEKSTRAHKLIVVNNSRSCAICPKVSQQHVAFVHFVALDSCACLKFYKTGEQRNPETPEYLSHSSPFLRGAFLGCWENLVSYQNSNLKLISVSSLVVE